MWEDFSLLFIMKRAKISIIAATDEDKGIGRNNKLLWHIPGDLRLFKKITLNHPVIMGRTTFESLKKPLPERTNIIVTRNKAYQASGCFICYSLKQAIDLAQEKDNKEIFIIGGGQIYRQGIKLADKLYLTIVKGNYQADTFFPDYSEFKKIVSKKEGQFKQYKFTFLELEREQEQVSKPKGPGKN